VRPSPKLLLRGLAKLVAVVAAASLAGIGLGAGLAKLSGDSTAPGPLAATSATAEAPSTPATQTTGSSRSTGSSTQPSAETATRPAATTTEPATATQPGAVEGTADPDVAVEVLSARLGTPSATTGHARVQAEVRVTNRAKTPVQITTALLISGDYEVPLDVAARDAAAGLLKPIAAGASATGKLRFTTATAATQRLLANPAAHLRIADRTVDLPLQAAQGTATTG
jgi:hypothetical protein